MNPEENQEQEKQQSSIDRANNYINKAQSIYKNTKRAKNAISTARTAISTARAGAAAIQTTVSAASNPVGIAIIVIAIIIITLFIVLTGGGGTQRQNEENPSDIPSYPGITYNLTGPGGCTVPCNIQKGQPVVFNIDITYDKNEAQVTIDKISAVVSISNVVFTINSVTPRFTTDYNPSLPMIKYTWKLSENISAAQQDSNIQTFHFEINATPQTDNIESSISLIILGARPETINPGPVPSCGEVDAALNSDYGMEVYGSAATCEAKIAIWKIYRKPYSSPTFKRLMNNGPKFKIRILPQDRDGCHGQRAAAGTDAYTFTMWGFLECIADKQNPESLFLIHETGHILRYKNYHLLASVYSSGPYKNHVRDDGSSCYNQGYVKSYSLRLGQTNCNGGTTSGITAQSESLSEALALYVYNKKTSVFCHGIPIYNFKSSCQNTYNYMKDTVFGGIEF